MEKKTILTDLDLCGNRILNAIIEEVEIPDYIITRTVYSDESGLIAIEDIEGYQYLNVIAIDLGKTLNTIRFGDDIYIGYYGGSSLPSVDTPVDLLFTPIPNQECIVYYIKLPST